MSAALALKYAANKRFVEFLQSRLVQLNMTPRELEMKAYGEAGKGGGGFYTSLKGQTRFKKKTMERLAPFLECNPDFLYGLYDPMPKYSAQQKFGLADEVTSEPVANGHTLPSVTTLPIFSMTVEQDGSVSIGCQLHGLTVDQALRVVQVMRDESILRNL